MVKAISHACIFCQSYEASVLGSTSARGRPVQRVRMSPPMVAKSQCWNAQELQVLSSQVHGVQRMGPRPNSGTCQDQLKVGSHEIERVLVQDEGSGTARKQHESERLSSRPLVLVLARCPGRKDPERVSWQGPVRSLPRSRTERNLAHDRLCAIGPRPSSDYVSRSEWAEGGNTHSPEVWACPGPVGTWNQPDNHQCDSSNDRARGDQCEQGEDRIPTGHYLLARRLSSNKHTGSRESRPLSTFRS